MKMTKRILSIVLVVLMLFSASMVATSAAPDGFEIADKNVSEDAINGEVYGFVGDTDMSETVSVRDATLIQKYAADLETLDENQKTIADVNFDGRVNVKDATTIQKFLADIPVDAPIGQLIYIPGEEDKKDPTTPTTPTTPTQPTVGDDSVTVYFINSANWATVNAYIWDADGNPAVEWPGTAMTKTDKQINGYDVYSFTFEPKFTNIIFNAGLDQAQTEDLTVQAGQYYYYKDATWYAKPEDVPAVDSSAITIYFIKPSDWANAYIYVMDAEQNAMGTAYPGVKMTKVEGDKYTYDVPADAGFIKFCDGDYVMNEDGTTSGANKRTENVAKADIVANRTYQVDFSRPTEGKTNSWAVKWDSSSGEAVKIYFIKPSDWANAYIHVMGDGTDITTYPGVKMELVAGDKYTYTVPAEAAAIKFCDGDYVMNEDGTTSGANKRTENVLRENFKEGRIYEVDFTKPTEGKTNSWAVKWTDSKDNGELSGKTVKIYFIKPSDWANAYIHVIGDGVDITTYPGVKMTKVEGDKYTYDVPVEAKEIKFADGDYVVNEDGTTSGANKRTENVVKENIVANRIYEVDFDKPTEGKTNSWAVKWTDSVVDDFVDVLGEIADATGDEIRVYFTRPSGWKGVYIYLMDAELAAAGTEYPGDKMVCVDVATRKYAYNVPGNAAEIKFTDGTYVDEQNKGENKRTENVAKEDIVKDRLYYIGKSLGGNKWEPDWDGKKKDVVEPGAVYFVNTANWAEVAAYAWNEGETPTWPGTLMTKTGDTVNGYDIYTITYDAVPQNIIFNNNDNGTQTGNLKFEEGKYYYFMDSKWYDSVDDIPKPRTEDVTVYFIKPADWDKACIHLVGNPDVTTYPGVEMTLVEGDKYSYVVPAEATAVKFTDGNATDTKRTENVVGNDVVDGRIYEVDFDKPTEGKEGSWAAKWEGKEEETTTAPTEPTTPPVILEEDYYLVGDAFGGETGTLIPETGLTLNLAAGTYKFKIKTSTGRVLGNGDGAAVINDTTGEGGWTFREGKSEVTLAATGAKYTFAITTLIENNEFKVKVIILAEFEKSGWSIIGAEGSEAVAKDFLVSEGTEGIYTYTTTLAAGTYKFRVQNSTGAEPVIYGSRANATDATPAAGVVFTTNNQAYDYTLTATGGKYTFTVNTTNVNASTGAIMPKVTVTHETITNNVFYFINSANWANVYAHVWGSSDLAAWPGTLMTKTGDKVNGFDVYSFECDPKYTGLVFNAGKDMPQTGNLTVEADKYYYFKDSKWYANKADVPELPAPGSKITIYFTKPDDWNKAYIYIMDAAEQAMGDAYPGTEMNLVDGNKYSYEVSADAGFIKFTEGPVAGKEKLFRTDNIAISNVVEGRVYKITTAKADNKFEYAWD